MVVGAVDSPFWDKAGGTELARRLLAEYPKLRVLYISGYTGGAVLPQEGLEKNSAFLKKPFTFAHIHKRLSGQQVNMWLDCDPEVSRGNAEATYPSKYK